MKQFDGNTAAAGLLIALLVGMSGSLFSEWMMHKPFLDKPILPLHLSQGASSSPSSDSGAAPLPPITPLLAAADIAAGKEVAKKCLQCHTFDKGGPNRIGPNLWGIVGKALAHVVGFSYSKGFQEKKEKLHWDVENLNFFLHKPRDFIPGTKMSFAGLSKDQDRANLIAYLRTLSDAPPSS